MSAEMEAAKQLFKQECDELLEDMESGLLSLGEDPEDVDSINAVFRAAHTIKGSSGVFGFDEVVAFTHVAESLLDKVRSNELGMSSDMVSVLLKVCDYLGEMIEHVVETDEPLSDELTGQGQKLVADMDALMGIGGVAIVESAMPVEHEGEVTVEASNQVETDNWHLSLRFGQEVLRNGMDPLSFLRYLSSLGEIVELTTLYDALPTAEEMDPEACYLGFEIDFHSDAEKDKIEQVFEFVKDDCDLRIIPPHSSIDSYIDLIHELPEGDMRLGEILVKGKALTERELEQILQMQQAQDGPKKQIGEILVDSGVVNEKVVDAAVQKQNKNRKSTGTASRSVRVDAAKLDQLINLVGELVIAGARSHMLAQRIGDVELLETITGTSRLVEEIRDSALNLRMVQIGDTFKRFQRVVHDVSKEIGKDIQLKIHGGETELDKTVVEKISDPLMHLVRNSMDHGIESADIRDADGKPIQGTVSLNAYHDSGSIVIEVSDDGAGLDKEKILSKAIERGVITPNQSLSDREIYRLIFEAGFSTAEQVTNLSGRGVGMDVVKRNIEALRGTIEVQSEKGVGTTMQIRLPLTLAIIDGFLVGVGSASYVVPLDMVVECVELGQEDEAGVVDHHFVNLRGEVLPFIRLREKFAEQGNSKTENLVVVQYAGRRAGLVVDELLGEFQTVIKPLGKIFQALQGVSGATILGSGDVAVILDVPNLIQQTIVNDMNGAGQAMIH